MKKALFTGFALVLLSYYNVSIASDPLAFSPWQIGLAYDNLNLQDDNYSTVFEEQKTTVAFGFRRQKEANGPFLFRQTADLTTFNLLVGNKVFNLSWISGAGSGWLRINDCLFWGLAYKIENKLNDSWRINLDINANYGTLDNKAISVRESRGGIFPQKVSGCWNSVVADVDMAYRLRDLDCFLGISGISNYYNFTYFDYPGGITSDLKLNYYISQINIYSGFNLLMSDRINIMAKIIFPLNKALNPGFLLSGTYVI